MMYGKRPSPATDPETWLSELDDIRRPQLAELDARIRHVAPGLQRYVDHGFLSYGRYSYRYASGRTGEWMCLALASNKQYISLYAGPIGIDRYAERLPKANLGRGCIRFKRVADVDLDVIDEVIRASAATDGQTIASGGTAGGAG
jgi:uncharacterized protein YdhG (YjbR/CyaY superfamily)